MPIDVIPLEGFGEFAGRLPRQRKKKGLLVCIDPNFRHCGACALLPAANPACTVRVLLICVLFECGCSERGTAHGAIQCSPARGSTGAGARTHPCPLPLVPGFSLLNSTTQRSSPASRQTGSCSLGCPVLPHRLRGANRPFRSGTGEVLPRGRKTGRVQARPHVCCSVPSWSVCID